MNARWINAEIATCALAGRAANLVYYIWEDHIFNLYDRFLILPLGRRTPKRMNGKAA